MRARGVQRTKATAVVMAVTAVVGGLFAGAAAADPAAPSPAARAGGRLDGGARKETPVGHSFRVHRKEPDHESGEFKLPNGQPAPTPWSVFFADGGIAFHSGDPTRASSGCVHLSTADAQAWFEHPQIGDQVQVVKASEEQAARAGS